MAYLRKKKDIYYVVHKEKGSRLETWIRVGRVGRSKAIEIKQHVEVELLNRAHGVVRDSGISFGEFSAKYLDYIKGTKAFRTYRRDLACFDALAKFIRLDTRLIDLSSRLLDRYKLYRIEKVGPRTINLELAFVRKILKAAVKWKYLSSSPIGEYELLKEAKRPPRFLSKAEIRALLKHTTPWLEPFLVIGLNSGMRPGEILKLRFDDCLIDKRLIRVQSSKTNSFRVIPMNPELHDYLLYLVNHWPSPTKKGFVSRQPKQREYLICHEDGSSVICIKKAFAACCRRTGIKSATPNTLRHTFASHLVMDGVPLPTVQSYLGHTSIETTMIYAHLSTEHLTEHINRIGFGVEKRRGQGLVAIEGGMK